DILVIDADRSAGFEVALHNHRDLGIQHGAACQSAADGLVDFHRICPCLHSQDKGLGHNSDGIVYNDLVGQLGDAAAACLTDEKSRRSKDIKVRLQGLEILLLASGHDSQRACHS